MREEPKDKIAEKELTILMPCLNEEKTIGGCIAAANKFISENNIDAEILVADNSSTDDSTLIAEKNGARVISVTEKGYGNALRGGIDAAEGKYIIMLDCDGSYDLDKAMVFFDALRGGVSIVVGNRFAKQEKGAMPFLHKYFGVPFLSALGRVKYGSRIMDFHCGLRGIKKDDFKKLNLQCGGMEFATEMIAKACRAGYKVAEIPIFYHRDGRGGKSHLRTLRDGIRHLAYMLTN